MKRNFLLFGLFIVLISLNSCYTDPDPGTGTVIVKDSSGFRVPGAYVTFSKGVVLYNGYTDITGECSYTHRGPGNDVATSAILDVNVQLGARTGQGIIKINAGEVTTEEITISIYP